MSASTPIQIRRAFTVPEMFLALLVMVLIASLVLPLLLYSGDYQDITDRRNAKLLAAVSFSAHQAGVDFVEGKEVGVAVQNLLTGGQSSSGRHFQAIGMSQVEARSAARHLSVENGLLVYQPGR